MFGFLLLGLAGAAGFYGHVKLRRFVRRRLRYTSWVEKRGLGIIVGAITAVLVSWPLTLAAGLLVGAGVGSGIAMGARDVRERRLIDE